LKNFKSSDIKPILKSLETQYENIRFEVWALNYHMQTQRSEAMLMAPEERKYWIAQLIKQREKEHAASKKK